MEYRPENPLVVQSDRTVLLEVNHARFTEARNLLAAFAELERSPEHIHTYRISPLSLWNSAAAGHDSKSIVSSLAELSKFPIPANVDHEITNWMSRWGALRLESENGKYRLEAATPNLMREVLANKGIAKYILESVGKTAAYVDPAFRGHLKMELIKIGWPVEDIAGYKDGAPFPFELRDTTLGGKPFDIRDYQRRAADAFHAGGGPRGGAGVIVLPCGAGKTIVGIAAMHTVGRKTLVLTTNIVAARQWKAELMDKTSITEDQIGEYSGESKTIRAITIATYQILTHRKTKLDPFSHFGLFDSEDWGLIVYDEVHLLPAPVFRVTAELQARRRLGLTATLVREDGKETEVFSLIGPKRYDVPWRDLESSGWIATAECFEYRLKLPMDLEESYSVAGDRDRFRIAAENPGKEALIEEILAKHPDDHVLVIGQYLDQLETIAKRLGAPILTGKTPTAERERLYSDFRTGKIRILVVSRVANFAVDLPDANVAIEVSGLFGSRQEEAQRLGRILRPKPGDNLAKFYVLVSRNTVEETFAQKRQLFLVEQGYQYGIELRDA
jgi:DNA excision repair protein ERCC-3